jgi:NAD(P) transhydrogenase subunit alpha
MLMSKGFGSVIVAPGAGAAAGYTDDAFVAAGATIGDAIQADIVLGISPVEGNLRNGTTTVSLIRPGSNTAHVESLRAANVTSLALDCVPRISRAQVSAFESCLLRLGCSFACLRRIHRDVTVGF